jgi:hypothetical protein
MTKFKFIFCFLLLSLSSFSQTASKVKIDKSNYYNYFQSMGTTNHLRISEVVPILIEEFKMAGISYYNINIGELIKINDSASLVLAVSVFNQPKFGFVYETSHTAMKDQKERNFFNHTKKSFSQYQRNISGRGNYITIDSLPNNIFLLKQTCYWYQYDNSKSYFPVSKEVIIEILRQDIRTYMKTLNLKEE